MQLFHCNLIQRRKFKGGADPCSSRCSLAALVDHSTLTSYCWMDMNKKQEGTRVSVQEEEVILTKRKIPYKYLIKKKSLPDSMSYWQKKENLKRFICILHCLPSLFFFFFCRNYKNRGPVPSSSCVSLRSDRSKDAIVHFQSEQHSAMDKWVVLYFAIDF